MLYFVATPIGNLKDITLRAIEVLKSVDEIACEDTRHSLGLLNAYDIKKPLFAYHKFNERESGEKIIEKLKAGKNIAVITDAGMPVVSDPGNILSQMLVEEGLDFTVVPGACAVVSALVLGGLDSSRFCFLGFMPSKSSERKEFLEKYKNLDMTLIFYSAPHDVKKDIESIYSVFGERRAVAVLGPMPATPGILSEVSPMSALQSTNCSGRMPYSSLKTSVVYSTIVETPFLVYKTVVLSPMS